MCRYLLTPCSAPKPCYCVSGLSLKGATKSKKIYQYSKLCSVSHCQFGFCSRTQKLIDATLISKEFNTRRYYYICDGNPQRIQLRADWSVLGRKYAVLTKACTNRTQPIEIFHEHLNWVLDESPDCACDHPAASNGRVLINPSSASYRLIQFIHYPAEGSVPGRVNGVRIIAEARPQQRLHGT